MKKTSLFLILLGIIITIYPLIERGYTWYWQRQLLTEFYHSEGPSLEESPTDLQQEYEQLQTYFQDFLVTPPIEENHDQQTYNPQQSQQPTKPQLSTTINTLGMIKIEKINLSLPILDGASEKNLKIGAARIKGSSNFGEIGNVALAAHRSHTRGRFFNRLDELEVGDEITIETKEVVYRYRIYKKQVVEPEDITVLNRNSQDQIITLITCHPLYQATHRLIIHGIREE